MGMVNIRTYIYVDLSFDILLRLKNYIYIYMYICVCFPGKYGALSANQRKPD